ncbi:helix-turn-helix domain-containing protein [Faecalimonas umbilicata]|nr:helix-turn-helix domain-containing protein [Faecalimonas umbilicata]
MYNRNLSARQVAKMTGLSKSTISRIMNEEVSPTADTLELLAKGLKIRITDLLESDYK